MIEDRHTPLCFCGDPKQWTNFKQGIQSGAIGALRELGPVLAENAKALVRLLANDNAECGWVLGVCSEFFLWQTSP